MLTAAEIEFLVGLLTDVAAIDQQLLQTLLMLIFNEERIGSWIYTVFQSYDSETATDMIMNFINSYENTYEPPPSD